MYKKPSAYKSGFIVKKYEEMGGKYKDDNETKNFKRWFNEKWGDVGNKSNPVYRPSVRINSKTPLTTKEINRDNLQKTKILKTNCQRKKELATIQTFNNNSLNYYYK